jgi:hypothetical protein
MAPHPLLGTSTDELLERGVAALGEQLGMDTSPFAVAPPIEGLYTLRFIRLTLEQYTLSQRGDLPTDARYLTFSGGLFEASINGIQLTNLNKLYFSDGNYVADISPFSGQTVDLVLRTRFGSVPDAGIHDIDAITFSAPEPSTMALALVGISVLAVTAFRRRGGGEK